MSVQFGNDSSATKRFQTLKKGQQSDYCTNNADYIFGSNSADDELLGGAGDDFLFPSEGADTLRGEDGDDTFYLQEQLLDGTKVNTSVFTGSARHSPLVRV